MKRFIALLAALLIVLGTLPTGMAAAKSDFEIKNGVLTKYTGKGGDVVIPEGVTEIAERAFWSKHITSVKLPSTLKIIRKDAIASTFISSITIPASVEQIGIGALRANCKLTSIKVESGNKNFKAKDGFLLSKDGKKLFDYAGGLQASSVSIPKGVEIIKGLSISNDYMTSVKIPSSVRQIEADAFYCSYGLKEVTIPATVSTLCSSAFDSCTSLKKLVIESTKTNVTGNSFYNVPKLKIYAPSNHPVKRIAEMNNIPFVGTKEDPAKPNDTEPDVITGMKFNKTKLTLVRTAENKKPTAKLKVIITPETESDQKLTWSYTNGTIIDVDPRDGTVTGLKAGKVTVWCSAVIDSKPYATCEVTVVDLLAEKLTLNKTTATLNRTSGKDNSLQLKAKVTPKDALNRDVKWSSSDKKIATVDKNGKVTPKKAGKVTITCRTKDGSLTASCEITIKNKAVKSITLDQEEATLKKGKTLELKIKKIAPKDALNKKVKWESSDEKIATVDKNGKVTAKKKGTCVITCTAKDGSNVKAEVKITVK